MENCYFIAPSGELDNFFDCFCGGGGSGTGILNAYDRLGIRASGTFVNHWDRAIDIHEANHPEHRHFREDLFLMDPVAHMPRQRYGLGWASPSCQQFSLSRGNRPINEQGRTHAETVVEWMRHCRPECQIVENVKQFRDWCRLKQSRCRKTGELLWAKELPGKKKGTTKIQTFASLPPGHARKKGESEEAHAERLFALDYQRHLQPDLAYRGEYFRAWIERIEALGYISDFRLLRSADYGDPTIRERLFVMFVRKDTGKRIVWPDQRFIRPGAKRPAFKTAPDRPLYPWPTARNSVIDWSHKGESIFLPSRKALAKATKRRIAIGLVQFGLKKLLRRAEASKAAADAFIVPQSNFGEGRVRSVDTPVSSVLCNHRGEGLAEPFALTSNKGFGDGVRDLDKPAGTLTCHGRGEGLVTPEPFMIPNFGEREGQLPRTHSVDAPVPTATSHGAGGLVETNLAWLQTKRGLNPHIPPVRDVDEPAPAVLTDGRLHVVEAQPFIVPKDQGFQGDRITSIDHPVPAVQTTSHDHLVEPCIIQANGQSTAISPDQPLGAVTGVQKQYVLEPHITHLRNGRGNSPVDVPVRSLTAQGQHQLLTEAFLMVLDNAGKNGAGQRAYSADEPIKTIPVKGNQTLADPQLSPIPECARFSLETLEDAVRKVAPAGIDISRVLNLLEPLMAELKRAGRDDIKPWVYVYYSNGAVGSDIDAPVPTVRCKEGTAICYPVLEFDGEFMLLDVLYRMLSVKELQRAQGFPDDFVWPEGITKTDIVKAIGNSVSCGVAEALTLAWYSQREDISQFFEKETAAA